MVVSDVVFLANGNLGVGTITGSGLFGSFLLKREVFIGLLIEEGGLKNTWLFRYCVCDRM